MRIIHRLRQYRTRTGSDTLGPNGVRDPRYLSLPASSTVCDIGDSRY